MYTMAGNKIHKSKGKEDKNKSNKGRGQNSEEADSTDHALLRKPVLTSITGFGQARKIYDWATEELKQLLSHECDLLYECKVCRNIFRSLANFISHKRVYCKEQFNPNEHVHFMKTSSTVNEFYRIKRLEEEYQLALKENRGESANIDDDERIPLTKDITEVIDKIARRNRLQKGHESNSEAQMILQEIPNSSAAVFQNMREGTQFDSMRKQINELDSMLSRSVTLVQRDGKCKTKVLSQEADTVIQISDDDDDDDDDEQCGDTNDILKCKTCDLQFSTLKTLKFHMKYKHVESRLVYPCPDCLEIFSTSWSVYRHLFKVHRKTAAQIRRLRESIHSKAFRMNNIPSFYEKRRNNAKQAEATRKMTEDERLDQENQAWMEDMEGDGSGPRCGGCGRAFERRAALVAHTHTCAPRSRARARHRRIQIQIRRDYNKGPTGDRERDTDAGRVSPDNKTGETTPVLEPAKDDVSCAIEDSDDPLEIREDDDRSNDEPESSEILEKKKDKSPLPDSDAVLVVPDDPSPDRTQMICGDPSPDHTQIKCDDPVEITPKVTDNPLSWNMASPVIRLPNARHAEESNLSALKQKIEPDVDLENLLCKRCDNRSDTLQHLYDHMGTHYKWVRYACKLCNFKHYVFEKLSEHVKVVHKLRGDKDFYSSTVKALDGPEALELAENKDEQLTVNGNSPDSQRASRYSSDSSRLSDDGSSSSTRMETGAKKRKMQPNKVHSKRKKETPIKLSEELRTNNQDTPSEKEVSSIEIHTSSNMKTLEENSSDFDDVDDKVAKRAPIEDTPSMASRRPVRRKTKRKNEDFEYDLSNLLKMEAQGYRESLSNTTAKSNNAKKKNIQEHQINYDNLNKDCYGAMVALSKNAVERSAAHMKMTSFAACSVIKEQRTTNLFVRPMLPKSLNKGDKVSPKKDSLEDKTDNPSSPNKESKIQKVSEDVPKNSNNDVIDIDKKDLGESSTPNQNLDNKTAASEIVKTNLNKSTIVPLKLRGQSAELFKNPLINKNIRSFAKPKLASKILVIKPFKRDPEALKGLNTPVQYQTITVKDSNKGASSENKPAFQKLLVEVPIVKSAIARTSVDTSVICKVPPVNSDATTESVTKPATNASEDNKKETSSLDVKEQTSAKSISLDSNIDSKQELDEKVAENDPIYKKDANIEHVS